MAEKTCFVIIGYGIKMDYPTGREIDLDKTYRNIIEPVFNDLGFICFRASDIKHSGVIDIEMYNSILKADFVLADLTTLNANVLYELGIRHAVRKNTTLIISDSQLKNPFDLSHIVIDTYEHLGKAIDYDEVLRFQTLLKEKVTHLLGNEKVDSPLYTIFPNLKTPVFSEEEIEEIKESLEDDTSLSELLEAAEVAKNNLDYKTAIDLLEQANNIYPNNDFIIQRMVLSTYKLALPDKMTALLIAQSKLDILNPKNTTDTETLGLSGAINKRLFELTGKENYLDDALFHYEKGFIIGGDYYNGINAAFLNNVKANKVGDKDEAYGYYGNAIIIRKKIIDNCISILNNKNWEERDDKEWVYLTLAEAYWGINDYGHYEEFVIQAKKHSSGKFSIASHNEQIEKLRIELLLFKKNH